jgi:hypothetical protein
MAMTEKSTSIWYDDIQERLVENVHVPILEEDKEYLFILYWLK